MTVMACLDGHDAVESTRSDLNSVGTPSVSWREILRLMDEKCYHWY